MRVTNKILLACFIGVVLAACGTIEDEVVVQGEGVMTEVPPIIETSPPVIEETTEIIAEEPAMIEPEIIIADPDAAFRNITTFYFDFDSSKLTPEATQSLSIHARDLIQSGARVVLEGHTDERGTREYNMALGERRAISVQKYLQLQGVARKQIEVISYGEERPINSGHNEAAWQQNRRVELYR